MKNKHIVLATMGLFLLSVFGLISNAQVLGDRGGGATLTSLKPPPTLATTTTTTLSHKNILEQMIGHKVMLLPSSDMNNMPTIKVLILQDGYDEDELYSTIYLYYQNRPQFTDIKTPSGAVIKAKPIKIK